MTSQGWAAVIVPLICRTILVSTQYSAPMECLPLLLAGIAMSTCFNGESVSANAMVGMFPRDDSLMGCTRDIEVVRSCALVGARCALIQIWHASKQGDVPMLLHWGSASLTP
jgi:hypothetical protein